MLKPITKEKFFFVLDEVLEKIKMEENEDSMIVKSNEGIQRILISNLVLASKGLIEEIKEYLKIAQSDIDAITTMRFCENETVNLILSSFVSKAKQSEILLSIDVNLSDSLPFSDTELCSLLSNTLENAIHACKEIEESSKRFIKLRMYSKNKKLCFDIQNTYQTEPIFHKGLPMSKERDHGFGTKSMIHIVEKYEGIFRFMVKDGWFIFQATI